MRLLYCVFQAGAQQLEAPPGVEDGPVTVVSARDLGVAISRITPSALTPTLSRIRAYQRVIEAFHRHLTVIPMRYGSTCNTPAEALRFLEERGEEYRTLLDELGDCIEMGVRVLLPAPSTGAFSGAVAAGVGRSGRAYLVSRREWYAAQDRAAAEQERVLDRICTSLEGLFVRGRRESASCSGGRLLSLYFLVPRNRVEPFRQLFRELSANGSAKLLLTGPWPPYNFVPLARIQKPEGDASLRDDEGRGMSGKGVFGSSK